MKILVSVCLAVLGLLNRVGAAELGLFEAEQDIGSPARAGTTVFHAATQSYVISGGGENMWFTNDSFHFVWKRVSGDFSIQSAMEWLDSGGDPHRKACLMVRQALSADSPYVDVAVHGDGLVSLQYRESPGGLTREIQAGEKHRRSVGLTRQGEVFYLSMAGEAPRLTDTDKGAHGVTRPTFAGPTMRLPFQDPLYVGLAVCAHDNSALERARFSEVALTSRTTGSARKPVLHCTLETITIASKDRRAVFHTTNHIEAPNWSRDGSFLLYNSGGKIYRLPTSGGIPELIDTGFANRCNNDHGLSPDGTLLAISDQSRGGKSLIYTLPASGGTPRQVTMLGPSYWHGWSPDGTTLAYCAERDGQFDIYTIPAAGGEEKRLTSATGLDDGPDYSPDGKYIYFNSERTGTMQIWRMTPEGKDQQQVTSDEFNNWFPHPSPDGKWVVFLSYEKAVKGHPENQRVWLRLLPVGGGPIQELARLFGGQGTINVPSWSPDSRRLAFVSYELLEIGMME